MTSDARFQTHHAFDKKNRRFSFTVPRRYTKLKFLSAGAQGIVASAVDQACHNTKVAIKKMQNHFVGSKIARRALREFVLLSKQNHPNIIKFLSVFTPQETKDDLEDIYIVMEYMDLTLTDVIDAPIQLHHEYVSKFIYQTLCAVSHLHCQGIIHRDLKPCNLVVNKKGKPELKLLDFGFARLITPRVEEKMSAYVITQWYRPPEVVLGIQDLREYKTAQKFELAYSEKVDVWSIGCILAEMITGDVLFKGSDNKQQWQEIVKKMGIPHHYISTLDETIARSALDLASKVSLSSLDDVISDEFFPAEKENPQKFWTAFHARDLISKMLEIDPNHRYSIAQALRHPYVSSWNNELNDRREHAARIDPGYDGRLDEEELPINELKSIIFEEVKRIENSMDIFGGM